MGLLVISSSPNFPFKPLTTVNIFLLILGISIILGQLPWLLMASGQGELICEDLPQRMCAFAVSSAGFRCVLEKKKMAMELTEDIAAAKEELRTMVVSQLQVMNTDATDLAADSFMADFVAVDDDDADQQQQQQHHQQQQQNQHHHHHHATANDQQVELECQTSTVIAGKHVPAEWVESDECVQLCGIERMTVGLSSDALFEPSFPSSPLCSLPCLNSCPNLRHLFSDLASGEGMSLAQLCRSKSSGGENHGDHRPSHHHLLQITSSSPKHHPHQADIDSTASRPHRRQAFEDHAYAPSPL